MVTASYKHIGYWWNNKDIELIEIDDKVYALNGWNGESFLDSWKCTGDYDMDASDERYVIKPISKENEHGEFYTEGYDVSRIG